MIGQYFSYNERKVRSQMKNRKCYIRTVVILTVLAILITIYPTVSEIQPGFCVPADNAEALILPPVCFTREMYSGTDDLTPKELLSSKNVKVKVRLKIADIICEIWQKLR